jgi:DNA-binding response OmpR family regulator
MSVATPRVLVVSESRITRRVVEMTFADQPLQLVTAASATNAASELKTRPPAVLLADIVLQGTDGFALARALRTHADGHKAVAILLAGQTELVDDAAVAAAQVSAVLRKPLDSHQLVDTVRQALRAGPPPALAVAPAAEASPADAGLALGSEPVEATPAAASQPLTLVPEPEPVVTAPLAATPVAPAVAESASNPSSPGEGLADTFHALLEVEQGLRAPLAPAALDDQDVERIAARVAGLLAADADRGARLDATVRADAAAALAAAAERAVADEVAPVLAAAVEQAVRELAPALVERIAHAVVRDEIARLRGTARVA